VRADPLTLISVFGKDVRYVVPMFQRPYVWNMTQHWEPLWDDVRTVAERLHDASEEEATRGTQVQVPPHFLGAIVLDLMQTGTGSVETRSVIDGQQRLTTLQVFIAATQATAEALGLEQQARILGKLLRNDRDLITDEDHEFKIWPTNADRETFRAVMRNRPITSIPSTNSLKLSTAMQYFRSVLELWAKADGNAEDREKRFTALIAALRSHLKVVVIDLDLEDNAQVIFETLNARGTPLQAADLIKNLLFQMAEREGSSVDSLYEKHWAPFDHDAWRQEVRQGRLMRPLLDVFVGHWLTMEKESETLVHQLFPAFRSHLKTSGRTASEVVQELARSARNYLEMQRYPWRSVEGQFFYRQTLMDTTTTIPLLLYLFGLDSNALSPARRQRALRALESYLVRRMLSRLTTKGYNRIFLDLLSEVKKRAAEADDVVVAFLARQQGESQSWPSDGEVRESLRTLPLYTALPRNRVRMVLEALEQDMRTDLSEQAQADAVLTIEHLLPQDWKTHWLLPAEADQWVASLARDRAKHTLGNLTLVTGKLNSSSSNGPWASKKDALREHSVLRLNWRLLKDDPAEWDEQSIAKRTEELTDLILAIWPGPDVAATQAATSTVGSGQELPGEVQSGSALEPQVEHQPLSEAEQVRVVLETRVPVGSGRMLAEALLGELLTWPDVLPKVGESTKTEDGLTDYVMLQRRKSPFGSFLYVRPREDHVRLDFRLPREYSEERAHAYARDVTSKNVYQVRMKLASLEDIPEALELAQAAFENAG
jgi:hypothetical protein